MLISPVSSPTGKTQIHVLDVAALDAGCTHERNPKLQFLLNFFFGVFVSAFKERKLTSSSYNFLLQLQTINSTILTTFEQTNMEHFSQCNYCGQFTSVGLVFHGIQGFYSLQLPFFECLLELLKRCS